MSATQDTTGAEPSGSAFRDAVIRQVAAALFGRRLVNNVHRALYVEAMVAQALPPGWRWNAGDWSSCDFVHDDGTRLEVKQSAARQSWHRDGDKPSRAAFDIAARRYDWSDSDPENPRWIQVNRRNAELWCLAHHPLTGPEADHRDPGQWQFHVLHQDLLPHRRSLSLTSLLRLPGVVPVPYRALAATIECQRTAPGTLA